MVVEISGSAGENWINYCKQVYDNGSIFHDEDEKIRELFDVFLIFKSFDTNDTIFEKYADKHIIEIYRKKMVSTEIIPELNSSYGKRLYDQLGVNQVDWLINKIRKKPETKSATISLLLPNDPGPRIPCLSVVDFKIRDNLLNLNCFFRSQNVARAYGNFIGVHDLHQKVSDETGYKLGTMKFFVSSAHIYEKDIPKVYELLKNNFNNY